VQEFLRHPTEGVPLGILAIGTTVVLADRAPYIVDLRVACQHRRRISWNWHDHVIDRWRSSFPDL